MRRERLMNLAEFDKQLAECGLDAIVAVSPANVFYTSGAIIPTQRSIPDRLAMTLIPREGESILLTCAIAEKAIAAQTWIKDMRTYREFARSPIHLLASVLKERDLAAGWIGIEKRYLTAEYYAELVEALPGCRFCAADYLFDKVRSIKTDSEIRKLREAALAAARTVDGAFQEARVGQRHTDLLECIRAKAAEWGASDIRCSVLAAEDTRFAAQTSTRGHVLQRGDLVRVNFQAAFDGYRSDIARMAAMGEASAEQRERYAKCQAIQQDIIDSLRPGVRACDVFEIGTRACAEVGMHLLGFHMGHGLGVGEEEYPVLQPHNQAELLPGMLLSIEPLLATEDGELYHLAEPALIGKVGAELLVPHCDPAELHIVP
jgi:Xaa-Pro dipeptidase